MMDLILAIYIIALIIFMIFMTSSKIDDKILNIRKKWKKFIK